MHATILGFRVKLICNGHRDSLVVPFAGIESEQEAIARAFCAARNGYPDGPIDVTEIESGRWCPTGLYADDKGTVWTI